MKRSVKFGTVGDLQIVIFGNCTLFIVAMIFKFIKTALCIDPRIKQKVKCTVKFLHMSVFTDSIILYTHHIISVSFVGHNILCISSSQNFCMVLVTILSTSSLVLKLTSS